MQDDDPFDAFLRPVRVEDFHAQEQAVPAGTARQSMRSTADDVIDLLGGIKKPVKPKLVCPKCQGAEFTTRTPLTGAPVNQCVKCGTKVYGVARSSAWMHGDAIQHNQGQGGAYYRGYDTPSLPRETHSPTYRAKSRSMTPEDDR